MAQNSWCWNLGACSCHTVCRYRSRACLWLMVKSWVRSLTHKSFALALIKHKTTSLFLIMLVRIFLNHNQLLHTKSPLPVSGFPLLFDPYSPHILFPHLWRMPFLALWKGFLGLFDIISVPVYAPPQRPLADQFSYVFTSIDHMSIYLWKDQISIAWNSLAQNTCLRPAKSIKVHFFTI